MTTIRWKEKEDELLDLAIIFQEQENLSNQLFRESLEIVFPQAKIIKGVDERSIAFLEFCFFRAIGPYSSKFKFYVILMRKIFQINILLRRLINSTAAASIANMVLGGVGGFKFKIVDYYELKTVLNSWESMGLKPLSERAILEAVLNKRGIREEIESENLLLLAKLKSVFPIFKTDFLRPDLNLSDALFTHFRKRFEVILSAYQEKGLELLEMIIEENARDLPVGVKRNNLLAYLIKKKHNFQCQICTLVQSRPIINQKVQAHHITLLSQGGEDRSENIIILCRKHHEDAHSENLNIISSDSLQIRYAGREYSINHN